MFEHNRRLKRNAAKCAGCDKVLESTHVHDYRTHSCTQLVIKMSGNFERKYYFMVDGGLDYCRRGWGGPGLSDDPDDHYIELSEYEEVGNAKEV